MTPWKDQGNHAPGEKRIIFDADINEEYKKTFCSSLFQCNVITGWPNTNLPEPWWLQETILFVLGFSGVNN